MRWRLNDPITKRELRRLLAKERHVRAECEAQMNLARKEKDHLEGVYAQLRAAYKELAG